MSTTPGGFGDVAGNLISSAPKTPISITIDNTAPTVTMTTPAALTNGDFPVSVAFSEDVTGFSASSIALGNATLTHFVATSATEYSFVAHPAADGAVTVDVAAGAAQDGAGNDSAAAAQLSVTVDTTPPSIPDAPGLDGRAPGEGGPLNNGAPIFTGTGEPGDLVSLFATQTTEATSRQRISTVAPGPTLLGTTIVDGTGHWSFTPSAALPDGAYSKTIAVTDAAGNTSETLSGLLISIDTTAPTLLLSTDATTANGEFALTATFSEDVTGFELADIVVTNGTAQAPVAVSATVYTVAITPAGDGTVTIDVDAGAAQDGVGNDSTAAAQLSVTVDGTLPGVVLSTDATSPHAGAFTATATFSEPVTGFALDDVTVSNGAASGFVAISGAVYTFDVTPAADGAVTVDVDASAAQDGAGNASTEATQLVMTVDITAPSVALTGPTDPVTDAFTVTATFSEAVSGLEAAEITVVNGTLTGLTGSGTVRTLTIDPVLDATVEISLAANVAQDTAGHGNTASNTLSVQAASIESLF